MNIHRFRFGEVFLCISIRPDCSRREFPGQVSLKRPLVHRGAVRADADRLVSDPEPLLHALEHGPQLVPGLVDGLDLLQREDGGLR
jgi:hypothetical protein